jgi:uncharacterized damage-inducible protein DinB
MTRLELLQFLRGHKLAVQASVASSGSPQAAVIGIVVTDGLEIFFDTLETSRKAQNLRDRARVALVIGGLTWGETRTVQYEGVVDEPAGSELARLKKLYFEQFPDGTAREAWPGITYIRVSPRWLRYSDFRVAPPAIVELTFDEGERRAPGPGRDLPEVWLRGPIEGVPPLLQPAAHSLLQSREEVRENVAGLTPAQLWARRSGAASAGFHVRHAAGSLDRLLTYARGERLSPGQLAALKAEADPDHAPDAALQLVRAFDHAVERALEQLRATDEGTLLEPRRVGRAQLPSTVIGLLFHAAEHTQRHAGQIVTTVKGL